MFLIRLPLASLRQSPKGLHALRKDGMNGDVLIGPNPCHECGGDYGDHRAGCSEANRKHFRHGERVLDESGTEWLVWEQISGDVCVFIPGGRMMTVLPASRLKRKAKEEDEA